MDHERKKEIEETEAQALAGSTMWLSQHRSAWGCDSVSKESHRDAYIMGFKEGMEHCAKIFKEELQG